jgi:hypothetical protein
MQRSGLSGNYKQPSNTYTNSTMTSKIGTKQPSTGSTSYKSSFGNTQPETKKFEQNDIEEAKLHLKLLKEKLGTNTFTETKTTTTTNNNYRKPFQPSFENNKVTNTTNTGTYGNKANTINTGTYGNKSNAIKTTTNLKPKMTSQPVNRNVNYGGDEYEDSRPIKKSE